MNSTPPRNPLRDRWESGGAAVGTWCEIPNAFTADILGRAGFDFVAVDWQHGLHGFESLLAVVHAISVGGTVPIVRVPVNAEWAIQKALDVGAFGVIVPLVGSAEEAAAAAAACRHAPRGVRSYGPIRASGAITDDPDHVNEQVLCIPMIETVSGIANIAGIASTPGVDALIIGPYDLSLSMEIPFGSPEIAPAVEAVLRAGVKHGVPVGRHFDTPEAAHAGYEQGFSFVTIGTDREMFAATAVATAAAARHGVRTEIHVQTTVARPVASAAE